MKRTGTIAISLVIFLSGMQTHAQLSRANARTWSAVRGGLFFGGNISFHQGDVPFRPVLENTHVGSGSGTNILFGVTVEKALSRLILLGVRVAYDPMSVRIEGDFRDPYRITDSQGNPYDVKRNYTVDYLLRYFSLTAFSRLYPSGGPGFYVGGGFTFSTIAQDSYLYTPQIVEPSWARGSAGRSEQGNIPDLNSFRYALDVMMGYELYYIYGFFSPEVHYDIGLSNVSDASFADTWNISNLRFLLNLTFPLSY